MKQNLLIHPLLFVAMLLVVLTGCEKDGNDFNKDDDDIEKDSENVNNFKTFTDSRDDNVYKYVTIGDQAWMAENLKYLPSVVGSATRSINTPFYYVYSYEGFNVTDAKATENYETYGVLYNFQAARNACPDGWYLPKTEQWHDLLDVVGFDGSKLQAPGSIQAGTGLWSRYFDTTTKTYIDGGTNETGFSALPGGYLPMDEAFQYINHNAYWWTRDDRTNNGAFMQVLYSSASHTDPFWDYMHHQEGLSVRCIKRLDVPAVSTRELGNMGVKNETLSGGIIADSGETPVIARGVCWSTNENPTVNDNKTEDGTGAGYFRSSITGLKPNTTYYLRAYATNSAGTAYGRMRSFTTMEIAPVISTTEVTEVNKTTAISGGKITDDDGTRVIARGVCWSTGQWPNIEDNKTEDGTGTGSFTSSITNLEPNTTYYVRAYATNSATTAYGSIISFTTEETVPVLSTTEITEINKTIEPGAVDTTLLSHTTDESIKENYNIWKEDMGGVLSVEDVSNAIIYAYNQPQNVCIREIVIAATKQLS